MTSTEIVALAREAGAVPHAKDAFGDPTGFSVGVPNFERFAALVAAAEREACALTAWEIVQYEVHADLADQVAQAIRARGDA